MGNVLRQGGSPVLLGKGLDGAGDAWVSSSEGCVCPGQQPISYPREDVDELWREGSRSGFLHRRETTGCGKAGPQATILILDQERVGL